jgi:hypothetical protein
VAEEAIDPVVGGRDRGEGGAVEAAARVRVVEGNDGPPGEELRGDLLADLVLVAGERPGLAGPAGREHEEEADEETLAGAGDRRLDEVDGRAAGDETAREGEEQRGEQVRAVGGVHEREVHEQLVDERARGRDGLVRRATRHGLDGEAVGKLDPHGVAGVVAGPIEESAGVTEGRREQDLVEARERRGWIGEDVACGLTGRETESTASSVSWIQSATRARSP